MKTSPEYMQGHYFIMPNEIFTFGLSPEAISVYAYLMRLENHKTNVCWAKQETIAHAIGVKSTKTVAKALTELEDAQLIYREPTTMKHDGKKVNGVQLFTIRPIEEAVNHQQYLLMEQLSKDSEAQKTEARITKYNAKHPGKPIKITPMDSAS